MIAVPLLLFLLFCEPVYFFQHPIGIILCCFISMALEPDSKEKKEEK